MVFALYWWVSDLRYAFRHPEATETERVLHLREVLLWR
jgi:hypothetical protein